MSITSLETKCKDHNDIDWESMQWEYENMKISMTALSRKYGTYTMAVSREARKRGWVKYDPIKKAVDEFESNNPSEKKVEYKKQVTNPNGMLDTVAVRKIQEIVKELGDNYSPVDEPLVVMYAKSYQRYLKLEAIVDEEGEVVISPKTGGTYMNPNFSALQAVISNMAKLGDKLGLSIASRKRIGLSLVKEEKTKSLFDMVNDMSKGNDIDV